MSSHHVRYHDTRCVCSCRLPVGKLPQKESIRSPLNKSHSQSLSRRCALAVMAKAPSIGLVKTRLAPPLTQEEAALLSACFLRDTANNISEIGNRLATEGVIVYAPANAEAAFDGLLPEDFGLLAQRGESLGDRLCNATEDLLNNGYDSVCLINSDSPTLPQSAYETAVESLSRAGDRVVLGAADDGGYYLIGLKKVHPNLFDRISWSTADVLAHRTA